MKKNCYVVNAASSQYRKHANWKQFKKKLLDSILNVILRLHLADARETKYRPYLAGKVKEASTSGESITLNL